ncbi:hypothetical protein GLOTRDRAFT_101530 [Gloeophyllum trabeum ATCC 11539]|uniref:HTH cro/C1-type domain-containing protein n=1 Tax=Gloeophyllum trabeum (strain ATCC 11539 / FP-39264 / Madison 617) TaxID=670483 RepID=S7RAP5_GLOTA|nr:uncharacterized protein GLOTRDRAFT_101530 [Gloeophyllum trabeum ATCC 11539]EPQ51335.1 hypothetical protein GLOTRDRAFT_101530 [Gloeophyllum trabeum ATCC 11539]
MAPDPRCTALRAAKERKGISYTEIAQKMGEPEQRVIDICTGTATATQTEFDKLAEILDVKNAPPHDAAHVTK